MNKFITILVATLIAIILITLFTHYDEIAGKENDEAITTFNGTVAGENESSVDTFFYYSDRYFSVDSRERLVKDLMKKIGVEAEPAYELKKTKNGYKSICEHKFSGGKITTELITIERRIDKRMSYLTQYISVHMEFENSKESAFYYREKLKQIFKAYDEITIEPDIYLTIATRKNGRLDASEKEEIAKNILEDINAKQVYDAAENNYECIYGYTDKLEDETLIGCDRVNINITFSYDEENDDTIIYQGIPIINSDF